MFYRGEIPFVRLLIPLISGIMCGFYFPAMLSVSAVLWLAGFLLLVLVIVNRTYSKHNLYRYNFASGCLIFLLTALIGFGICVQQSQKFSPDYFSRLESDAMVVRVTSEPKLSGDILRFETNVKQVLQQQKFRPVKGKLLIALKADAGKSADIEYGDELLVPNAFHEVEPPYNPAEFNFKQYLATRGVYYQAFINQMQITTLKKDAGNLLISFALKLRKKLIARFYRFIPDKNAAALASTLILGYRADLNRETINSYSKTGTMHVLSVSGMHVGIVFIILTFVFSPFKKFKAVRYFTPVAIVILIWFYSLITGFSPSVCRAAVMLSFFVIGKTFKKRSNTYNIIAFSAFVLLLYNPFFLFDVGFQLSYLAVTGLIFFHPRIHGLLRVNNYLLNKVWTYCALSLSAQLATFPLSIYYFHQFPVYFLISNLFIVIPVAIIMYAGIAFLIFQISFISIWLGRILCSIILFSNNGLRFVENLPFSNIGGIWITTLQYTLLYIVIALAIWAWLSKNKKLVFATLSIALVFVTVTARAQISKKRNHSVIFYSLRKNSAIGYLKNNEAIIISDLKPEDKTVEFSITPFLDSCSIKNSNFMKPDSRFQSRNVFSSENFICLGNYKIYRWTNVNNGLTHAKKAQTDALLLSYNPRISLAAVQKNVNFKDLLIDGTNSDYRIKQWQKEAEQLGLAYHILKKNKAYLINF